MPSSAGGAGNPPVVSKATSAPTGCSSDKAEMKIASWNVRTLREGDLEAICCLMKECKFDILVLQETRRRLMNETREMGEYCFFGSGNVKSASKGVGILVKKEVVVEDVLCVSERVMAATIENRRIVVVYGPTEGASEVDKDSFWCDVEKAWSARVEIIMGDFNARIGKEFKGMIDLGVCRYGLEESTNDNGWRMLEFLKDKKMVMIDSWFRHRSGQHGSWRHPGTGRWASIDHILVARRLLSSVVDCRVRKSLALGSDHAPLGVQDKNTSHRRQR